MNWFFPLLNDFYYFDGLLTPNIRFKKTDQAAEEKSLVRKVVEDAVGRYQFYEEKSIDKNIAREQIQAVLDHDFGDDYGYFLDSLGQSLQAVFRDPHFKVIYKKTTKGGKQKRTSAGAVRLREMQGNYFVAAVLADAYRELIPLGSRVLSIDGFATEDIDVGAVMNRSRSDSVRLEFMLPGGKERRKVTVRYDQRMKVTANFISSTWSFCI